MFLIINTAQLNKTFIGLRRGHFFDKRVFRSKYKEADKLLPEVSKLLEKNKIRPKALKGIVAVVGSDKADLKASGFTATRIGVVAANSLSFALGIPAVGVSLDEFEELGDLIKIGESEFKKTKKKNILKPVYSKEPNINLKKVS